MNSFLESIKLLPFLFIAFFIIELIEHKLYISSYGQDMEEIRNWHFERPVEIID